MPAQASYQLVNMFVDFVVNMFVDFVVSMLLICLQVLFLYKRYFSSMAAIAVATLHIINGRVFPTSKHNYEVTKSCMLGT